MTRPIELVDQSLELAEDGLSTSEIARRIGVPRSTVRDWLTGHLPRHWHRSGLSHSCAACGGVHRLDGLPAAYVYLLAMYLGDGCLSAHPRGVFKLRISLDARYPGIAHECERAIKVVMPSNRVGTVGFGTWHELYAYSKCWPCLLPAMLLRGLIHSDGCRFINTGRAWSHPRYSFANKSDGIKRIFCDACDLMGLHWTVAPPKTIYVSRKADVAVLDRFVGPKY